MSIGPTPDEASQENSRLVVWIAISAVAIFLVAVGALIVFVILGGSSP